MFVYLPIAEIPINAVLVIGLGLGVGFVSGLFGVGGGFLMTPFLLLFGIPPAVAVGTESGQIFAASLSGTLARWRNNSVDLRMGLLFIAGGLVGSVSGIFLLRFLLNLGQFSMVLSIVYVVLLTSVGGLMLIESLRSSLQRQRKRRPLHRHYFFHNLPLKLRFSRSHLYESAIPPMFFGVIGGLMSATLGTSGGFFLVPAMIYLLGMPTLLAVGTSLFQTTATSAVTLYLQAEINHSVDLVLVLLLIGGGTLGAQWGSRTGLRLSPVWTRFLMALLVLGVAVTLAYDLFVPPTHPIIWLGVE